MKTMFATHQVPVTCPKYKVSRSFILRFLTNIETSTSRTDCCCNGGGAWGSEDACTKCPAVSSLAYEEMCGLPAPIVVKIDEPDADFSQSDNSNSVAVDDYAAYEDSESGNALILF